MSHFRVNRNPTPRDLRWFGLLLPLFVALVGAIARWQFDAPAAALGIWSAGGALAALYWAAPPLRRPDSGGVERGRGAVLLADGVQHVRNRGIGRRLSPVVPSYRVNW